MHRRGRSCFRGFSAAIVAVAVLGTVAPVVRAGNDPLFAKQWGFSVIGAPTAWSVGTGAGVTIAVVDSGVDLNHEDLRSKLLPGKDFVNSDDSAQDDFGHGTHVAGTAAAVTGNGVGGAGTAPGASILPVKVLDNLGTGSVADVSAGIEWAADRGAQVINLSLGPNAVTGSLFGNGLGDAVNHAWSRGSIVVIAAGNDYLFPSSAGDIPAIVVTATTRQDQKAGYASTVGPAKWGLAAPGGAGGLNEADDILSTLPNKAYGYMAGTSMAAPHVAGAAAVLRGMGLSPQATIDRLLATAKDLGAPGRDDVYGAGRLDLACAVGRCGGTTTNTTAPSATGGSTSTDSGTPGSEVSGPSGSPGSDGSGSGSSAGTASGAGSPAAGPGSTATPLSGGSGRATGSRPAGLGSSSGPAHPAMPAPAPPALAPAQPAGAGPAGVAPPDGVGANRTFEPGASGLSLSSSAGEVAPEGGRRNPVLTGVACVLILLVAFSGLGLRRRRLT